MSRVSLALTSATLLALLASCTELPPGEPGIFGNNGASAGSSYAQAGMGTTAEERATGAPTGSFAVATVMIIAKHQATEHQRQVAKTRARAALRRIHEKQEREIASNTKARSGTHAPTPKPQEKIRRTAAETPVQPKARTPRYLAVETEKDARTAPAAAKSVVIFDTQTQEIVGNNVYDVKSTPPVGSAARFETFTAEYVGTGF